MAGENLGTIKFIKKGVFEFSKAKNIDFHTISNQTLVTKGVIIDHNAFKQLN